ncbi:ThiF family adenylyltransferase [Bombiscardovia coagulans]|uniref:UBA/THIF-type NAD/FAD binding protein n=1 Tax=Bombiscardovia coagulans TaxID=686666 RepID=A0A261EPL6_9BIFI|nr:ThiF family adenylyltransferase [Bombiscardovia coagulans]OZG48787.1 UBA/THIF-type NAD/FAD binding protein [Bombiscardovia coagulans]
MTRYHINSGGDYFIGSMGDLFIVPRAKDFLYRIQRPNESNRMVLELFASDTEPEEVVAKVCCQFDTLKAREVENFIDELIRAGILVKEDTGLFVPDIEDRYSRQLLYFEQNMFASGTPHDIQAFLSKKHVVIVGVGGAGSPIAQMLAGVGIGSLTLIDSDHVDMTNLGRQIAYSETDIGIQKVMALKTLISKINPHVKVTPVAKYLNCCNALTLLEGADIAVLAADEPANKIEHWMDDACMELGVPYLSVSNSAPVIRVGPLYVPNITGGYCKYRDLLVKKWEESESFSRAIDEKSDSIANNVWSCYALGSLAVGQLIQWLCTGSAAIEGRSMLMNVDTMRISEGIALI